MSRELLVDVKKVFSASGRRETTACWSTSVARDSSFEGLMFNGPTVSLQSSHQIRVNLTVLLVANFQPTWRNQRICHVMWFVVARRAQKVPEEAKRVGDVKSFFSGTKLRLILFCEANMCWQWALMLCTRKNGLGVSFFLFDGQKMSEENGWRSIRGAMISRMLKFHSNTPWAGGIYLVIPMGQLRGRLIHKGDDHENSTVSMVGSRLLQATRHCCPAVKGTCSSKAR